MTYGSPAAALPQLPRVRCANAVTHGRVAAWLVAHHREDVGATAAMTAARSGRRTLSMPPVEGSAAAAR